ncbi:Uncharacterised protein [Mycobacteroides abscessus]|nr:Uncharacterised protein [Mycobacteroides abscessus]
MDRIYETITASRCQDWRSEHCAGAPSAPWAVAARAARHGALVTLYSPEALGLDLPFLPEGRDLVMVAADEVPPHDDLLAERFAAQQNRPGRYLRRIRHGELLHAGAHISQLTASQPATGKLDGLGIHQQPMLESGINIESRRTVRFQQQFRAEQRSRGTHRRHLSGQCPQEHPQTHPACHHGVGGVMLEIACRVARFIRQRDPQLHPVQRGGLCRRHLRVANAAATRHQVELPRPHHRMHATAVAVLDLAGEQPAHRLQAGMRVRRDIHATGLPDIVGPVMIGKAPRPDQ